MSFLFGNKKKSCDYVITKSLYDQERERNDMYRLRQKLSPNGEKVICTTFVSTYPFLRDMLISKKDTKEVEKLKNELFISVDQADEVFLAKKMKCPLMITSNQLWLAKVAKQVGVKTRIFR